MYIGHFNMYTYTCMTCARLKDEKSCVNKYNKIPQGQMTNYDILAMSGTYQLQVAMFDCLTQWY